MTYEPKPGVLTEEDKARLVLGNTGHDVDIAEILEVVFEAGKAEGEFESAEDEGDDEAETAIPKTADLTDAQQDAIDSQNSTMEQMTDAPETGGPSSHIDGNPLEESESEGGEADADSAHASETGLASPESADHEGADEPLADPVENKTAEPDAGKATPGLGNDEPAPSTDESHESASADVPAPSTESTPSFSDEPALADSTATDAEPSDAADTDGIV